VESTTFETVALQVLSEAQSTQYAAVTQPARLRRSSQR
jgi:hypothetical protein